MIKKIINQKIKNYLTFSFLPSVVHAEDGNILNFGTNTTDFENLEKIAPKNFLTTAIEIALTTTIIVFFFILVQGGIKWITSNGDEKKLTIARSQITNGIIGLVIILSSWAILNLISTIFEEIEILNLTIPSFLPKTTYPPGGR